MVFADSASRVWISSEDAAAVASLGFRIVQAPSNYFYLDCGGGGWVSEDFSALFVVNCLLRSVISPLVTVGATHSKLGRMHTALTLLPT